MEAHSRKGKSSMQLSCSIKKYMHLSIKKGNSEPQDFNRHATEAEPLPSQQFRDTHKAGENGKRTGYR